jgi:hypothetical protein
MKEESCPDHSGLMGAGALSGQMLRALALLAVLLLTPAAASAAGPVDVEPVGAEPVPRILDDTPEFCRSLAIRLATLPSAQSEPSRSLGEQGIRLCDEGHFRIGIAKLRRALRAAQDTH